MQPYISLSRYSCVNRTQQGSQLPKPLNKTLPSLSKLHNVIFKKKKIINYKWTQEYYFSFMFSVGTNIRHVFYKLSS